VGWWGPGGKYGLNGVGILRWRLQNSSKSERVKKSGTKAMGQKGDRGGMAKKKKKSQKLLPGG